MKNKIGFFGGCFNPVTNAHLNLIKDVILRENLDKVYFVPMGDLYPKKGLVLLKHRIKMLENVLANEPQIDILNISNNDKKMCAIDSFRVIEEMFPEAEKFFIMGSDNFAQISKWKESEELLQNYKYIILDREKGNTKDVSSSLVRTKINRGENVEDLVPKEIIEYIEKNNLYRGEQK